MRGGGGGEGEAGKGKWRWKLEGGYRRGAEREGGEGRRRRLGRGRGGGTREAPGGGRCDRWKVACAGARFIACRSSCIVLVSGRRLCFSLGSPFDKEDGFVVLRAMTP